MIDPPPTGARVATAAVVAVVGASVVAGVALAASHVLTERDPGVYVTTARQLARSGDLVVDARPGPFADDDDVDVVSQGWSDEGADGRIRPQFLHGWPVLLAAGHALGGDALLFALPPVVAGLGLLAVAVLARRWVRPLVAVVATAGLALAMPWALLSRDAYSELPTAVAVLGGWWALMEARRDGSPRRGLVAGLVLGTALCLRVDAALYLAPIPLALALDRRAGRPPRALVAVAVGLGVAGAVAALDATVVAPDYLRHIRGEVVASGGVLAASCLLGAALASGRGHAVLARLAPHRRALAAAAGGVVLAAAAVAGLVRPWLQTVRDFRQPFIEALQREQGLEVDGTRRWSEDSLVWLTWYVGVPLVVAGVVGLARGVRDLVLGRHRERLPLVLGTLFASAVYLWRPSATPDHLWVTRRFLVATLPVLVLLGAEVADHLLCDRRRAVVRALGVGVLATLVAVPAVALAPVAGVREQRPYLTAVRDTCDAVGADSALVVRRGGGLELVLPPALRAWCGVPVATVDADVGPGRLRDLAARWAADGRRLFVVGPPDAAVGRPVLEVDAGDRPLEQSIGSRPDGRVERRLRYAVAPAGAGA